MPMPAAQLHPDGQMLDAAGLGEVDIRRPLKCLLLAPSASEMDALRACAARSRYEFVLEAVPDAEAARTALRERRADLVFVSSAAIGGPGSSAASLLQQARVLDVPMMLVGDDLSDAEIAEALRTGVSDVLGVSELAGEKLDQAVEAALDRHLGPAADQLAVISNLQAENETLRRIAIRNMRLLKGQTLPLMSLAWRMMQGEQIRDEDRNRYVKGLARVTRHVAGLIDDTVITAATHRALDVEEDVDLTMVLETILRDDLGEIANSRAHVVVHPLPVLRAKRPQIEMLFEELLLTAVRNGRVGRVPEIEIGCGQDEDGNPLIWMLEKGLQLSARKQSIAMHSDLLSPPNGRELEDSHAWSLCQRLVERNHGQLRIADVGESSSRITMLFPKRLQIRPAIAET
ncbi:MAG: hypothetical protein AAGH68_13165 [Pseudomonadota bacterium]